MKPTPITPRSLDVQAADVLREQILSGALAPGARLLEIELAEQLNLSRGTIRSALQQLIYEGLVVQVPYRGCAVCGLTADDAWELYTLRQALESLAARLAAAAMTANKAEVLTAALTSLRHAAQRGNRRDVAAADFALHQAILQISGHRRLQQQYRIIEQQIRLYILSCNTLYADPDPLVEQHERLVEAIVSGNAELAEQLAKQHHSDGEQFIAHLRHSGSDSQVL